MIAVYPTQEQIQALLSDDQFATFVERLRNIEAFRTDIDSQAHK